MIKHLTTHIGLAVVGLVLMAFALVTPARADALLCISDWGVATGIVRREGLADVDAVTAAARKSAEASVVRTILCKQGQGYVYRVILRDRTGRLRTATVDAKAPFAAMTLKQ